MDASEIDVQALLEDIPKASTWHLRFALLKLTIGMPDERALDVDGRIKAAMREEIKKRGIYVP